ncbi:MAG: DUF2975 domain-containing protein [Bifidobacteriaceae bacterium]|jgi:hypothetical protein|nr:DUF2975 domain-containing protein [Bifidobacteriaceae bacterium]
MGAIPSKGDVKTGLWVLDVLVWLGIVQFVAWGLVQPLAGLGRTSQPPGEGGWFITSSSERLQFELTPAGIQEVFGPDARLPESGYIDLGEVTLTPSVSAEVTFAHPGWADFLATTGSSLIFGATGLAVMILVLQLVRKIRRGSPFDTGSVRRLYAAGLVTWAGGAANLVATSLGSFAAAARPVIEDLVYPAAFIQFDFVPIGAVFGVIAEDFRRGLALQKETDGLV